MRNIQNVAAYVFISAVGLLSLVSVLAVWKVFENDVISKSFETIGLLAIISVIVMVAGRFVGQSSDAEVPEVPNPAFHSIRQFTLSVLIGAVSVLAFLGVLSIWEIITNHDVLYKSMSSVGILAFASFIMVMTCLQREGFFKRQNKSYSIGGTILVLIAVYVFLSLIGSLVRWF